VAGHGLGPRVGLWCSCRGVKCDEDLLLLLAKLLPPLLPADTLPLLMKGCRVLTAGQMVMVAAVAVATPVQVRRTVVLQGLLLALAVRPIPAALSCQAAAAPMDL
jgi:hypothetical protein